MWRARLIFPRATTGPKFGAAVPHAASCHAYEDHAARAFVGMTRIPLAAWPRHEPHGFDGAFVCSGGQSKESTYETNSGVKRNEVDDGLCRRARGYLCVCAIRAGAGAPSPSWPAP